MQRRNAKKLHNRDEVKVRIDGTWISGHVVGDPKEKDGTLVVDVQTSVSGFLPDVDYREIR